MMGREEYERIGMERLMWISMDSVLGQAGRLVQIEEQWLMVLRKESL